MALGIAEPAFLLLTAARASAVLAAAGALLAAASRRAALAARLPGLFAPALLAAAPAHGAAFVVIARLTATLAAFPFALFLPGFG